MNLLKCKKLLISEKESLPTLTCGSSQKVSASSDPYKFVFFSEKLNFSKVVRLQSKLRFFYSPHRSVNYSLARVICLMKTLVFLWTRFSMTLRFLPVFTVRFRQLPERRPSLPSSLKWQIASETVCRCTFS
ncbi:uncharacterized protein TNCV_2365121 [Trichonephila clavipes]|nr:uncharacterized protein TNCV_2365121 [Trichonephila clavipes]